LLCQIGNALRKKNSHVFIAPFDVRFPKKENVTDDQVFIVYQPDLCIVCDKSKIDSRGCIGPPDFIIEVLSRKQPDLTAKFDTYQESGVKEYWVVHPEEETVLVYRHNGKTYDHIGLFSSDVELEVKALPGLSIDFEEVFGSIDLDD
jgi:Uma2 family endonuclease